jgi:adenine-specific DNA-methyltransferase
MQSRNTMPPAITAITDSKFNALKAKLRELFELDKSDLDFGIYRIIAAKNKEVTEFLDRQLKDVVKATLAAHGAGAADQVQAELDKTIASLRAAEVPDEQIETNKKVTDLRAKLAAAGGAAAADLEADIYNHLLAFFGRYYDEGDFISQRRYKGDTYAIPYSGEEVTLHWANKDQYYIKSGEWHKDYRFKVGSGDKTVRLKLVEATQEVANNKEADDAKRRYILAVENPVEEAAGTLTLRFEFRVPTQADKDRAAAGAVAVFGGDYAKASNPKKGDEREQFCADAEKRALAAMPEAWRALIATSGAAATADKPARTLLGKHLDHFSARNTFDYFIHKDLGGFLRRELDFYLKNEVVRLDDLESLPPDHLQRVQGKVKAIRAVASRLIAFLGSLEDFQKKMWLKKKFVLNTNWLVTVDRIPPALRDVVASNAEQWAEWESLGFKPENAGDAGLFGGAEWGTRAYLEACDKLVVSTRLFEMAFQQTLLASEEVADGNRMLEDTIAGLLINGDNEHAIRLLLHRLAGHVDCLYLDPPYNTDGGPINYKNGFKSSSWISMIHCRLAISQTLLRRDDGILCMTIDDFQQKELHAIIESVFGKSSLAGTVVVRSNPSGRPVPSGFAQSHEYAIFATTGPGASVGLLPRSDDQAARYKEEDERGRFMWELFRKRGSASERRERPSMYFPLYLDPVKNTIRVPTLEWDNSGNAWVLKEQHHADEVVLWPIDENGVERRWRWSLDRTRDEICQLRADRNGGDWTVYYRYRPMLDGVLPTTVWSDAKYSATEHGTGVLKKLFTDFNVFSYPKSIHAVSDCIAIAGLAERANGLCLDYFAG